MKNNKRHIPVIAALAVILTTAGTANAQIINGGFEDPDIPAGSFRLFPSIPGWTADVGVIEIQDNIAGSPFEGNQFTELDSTQPSAVSQVVNGLTAGRQYELSFAFSARAATSVPLDNVLSVTWDGVEVFNGQAQSVNPAWTVHTIEVTASAQVIV